MPNKLIIGDNLTVLKTLPDNSIDAICTDPPYLTKGHKLTYFDSFTEPQWIEFMTARLIECKRVMKPSATMLIHIDQNMMVELHNIIFQVFGKKNVITTFIWKKKSSASAQSTFATVEHEYIVAVAKNIKKAKWNGVRQFENKDITKAYEKRGVKAQEPSPNQTYPLYHGDDPNDRLERLVVQQGGINKSGPNQSYPLYHGADPNDIMTEFKTVGGRDNNSAVMAPEQIGRQYPLHIEDDKLEGFQKHNYAGGYHPNQDYPLHHGDDPEDRLGKFDIIGDNPKPQYSQIYPLNVSKTKISLTPFPGSIEVKPMNAKELGCWRAIPKTCQKLIDADMLVVKNGKIYQKQYAHFQFNKKTGQLEPFVRTTPIRTILQGDKFPTNLRSNKEIKAIFGSSKFTYAKPLELVKNLLKIISNEGDTILDIFAGSGTTGQAAYELKRNFILIQLDEGNIPNLTKQRLDLMVGAENYTYDT